MNATFVGTHHFYDSIANGLAGSFNVFLSQANGDTNFECGWNVLFGFNIVLQRLMTSNQDPIFKTLDETYVNKPLNERKVAQEM